MASPITINLASMAGEAGQLAPLPADASVCELARAVRKHMSVPIAAQNLIFKGELITDPTQKLVDLFGPVDIADIMVVKRALTEEEHAELYSNLVRAAAGGDSIEVSELLEEGARVEPSTPESNPDKPTKSKCPDDSDSDISVDEPVSLSLTPMMMAAAMKNDDLAKMLRERGAREPEMQPETASLAQAFRDHNFDEVVRHLAGGADVNTKLCRGEGISSTSYGVPLHACCALHRIPGAYEVAQLLINMKADTAQGDSEGDTPLAHARYFGAKEIYDVLENNGAVMGGPYYRMFGRT